MPIANARPSSLRHVLTMAGHFLGHVTAVVLGFVLIIVGLAMGVTMVLLPAGIVIGLVASRWSWVACSLALLLQPELRLDGRVLNT